MPHVQQPAVAQFLGAAALPAQGSAGAQKAATMFKIGLALVIVGCTIGMLLNIFVFIIPAVGSPQFGDYMAVMFKSAIIAYLPVAIYLAVPYIVDRYDPEPWWALAGVFAWGALFATGVSAVLNTIVGMIPDDPAVGGFLSSALAAPVFEEATKGLAILGMVVFLRKEFDGVVDGIIYGTFAGIGFAATENVIYYMRFHQSLGASGMDNIFVLRGMVTPWLHPMFTAMTGIGFGLAREKGGDAAKFLYPIGGYFVAVFMHAWWNGMPQVMGCLSPSLGGITQILNLIIGVLMALAFFGLICWLVYRKARSRRRSTTSSRRTAAASRRACRGAARRAPLSSRQARAWR
jgi:RsiW-degrading membrane proteinase PrsW (M82 family)